MNGPNVLEARALGKRYGDQWALRDCTLALPAGRVVGLVGPNGAGKTTLLQLAVGVLAPSAGQIAVFGRDPRETTSVLPRLGFVAQDSPLYRSLTVGETLAVGRHLNARFDEQWARERLGELKVPLERKVGELSGGQRAQVALAAALAKRPQLLLLVGPRKRVSPGGGIAAVVRESHSERQSTLFVRTDGPILDPAWAVHEVDLEELVLAYMGERSEPRLRSLPTPLEANA